MTATLETRAVAECAGCGGTCDGDLTCAKCGRPLCGCDDCFDHDCRVMLDPGEYRRLLEVEAKAKEMTREMSTTHATWGRVCHLATELSWAICNGGAEPVRQATCGQLADAMRAAGEFHQAVTGTGLPVITEVRLTQELEHGGRAVLTIGEHSLELTTGGSK